jgi:hypothetical protein
MKTCVDCGKQIEKGIRCSECRLRHRKEYMQRYNKLYRVGKPKSAINGKYYQYYKFVSTLTDDELRQLIVSNRKKIYETKHDFTRWTELKTKIKIVVDILNNRKNYESYKNIESEYNKDEERQEILKRGVYENS